MISCRQVCERVLELKKQRPHTRHSEIGIDFEYQSLVAVAAPKLAEALLIALEALGRGTKHYECEDAWYSCPMSDGGCLITSITECTCGANLNIEALAAIDKIFGKAE
jgi:hypothetical protein